MWRRAPTAFFAQSGHGGAGEANLSCLPFLIKGRCRAKRDGGDKKFGNREGESGKECPLVRKNF